MGNFYLFPYVRSQGDDMNKLRKKKIRTIPCANSQRE